MEGVYHMRSFNAKCTKEFNESGVTIELNQMVKATHIPPTEKQKYKSPSTWSIEGIDDTITSIAFGKHFKVPQSDYILA